MNPQPATKVKPNKEFYLKALNGGLKSNVYRLTSKEIFIGRDPSNHIIISDDSKASRRHARLLFHKNKYYIQNLSKQNSVSVNGEKVKQAQLFNNCVILVGEHSFKFVIADPEAKSKGSNHLSAVPNGTNSLSGNLSGAQTYNFKSQSSETKQVKQNKNALFIVLGIIIVLILGSSFLKPKPVVKKSVEEIETNQKILERIKDSQAKIEAYKKNLDAKGANSKDYKKSKELYIKGSREFQKSHYSSAIGSFEVALVHNPENIEAKRYLELSKRKAEELIEYNMNQGRVHKDNNKFDFCISSFKNVMIQLNDKTDSRYNEAKKLLKECSLLQRSKY